MKTLNYVKILLLCVFTIGLASCGDDVYTGHRTKRIKRYIE